MACPSANAMISHMKGEKMLSEFTNEEIAMIPIDYLINYVDSSELLDAWGRLPSSYKSCFPLQIRLPCFLHYNRVGNHFDGGPMSQEKCLFCKNI